ncbi:MAG: 50S ribosomal protein L5 [Candidatus Pacebacteria bacterium]|nr:50S ribosomal protein L5 [Candidatus Paceibacterota bacterium]
MNRLRKQYQEKVAPALKKEFDFPNLLAVPKIEKVVLNMGVTDPADPKAREKIMPILLKQFEIITGQKAVVSKARLAIANFKLREGDPLGVMVTLRGEYMWEFLDKLISLVLPRVKDFRGVSTSAFDGEGNYSLGIEEQIAFPEIDFDQIERIRGLQINLVISNSDQKKSFRLLELLGMPFEKEEIKRNE